MKKVLNLYAGIGGNRKLWKDVEVTAEQLSEDLDMPIPKCNKARLLLRNCVKPKVGLHIFMSAYDERIKSRTKQETIRGI